MGPGPLRTARGAGLEAVLDVDDFFDAEEERPRAWLPDDRDRELDARPEDVLLLRDPGGEDVRVAMLTRLGHSHTSPTLHTPRGVATASHQANPSTQGRTTSSVGASSTATEAT